ncbi:TIM barrel protein [Rubrobacter marinus]|uniref:TIM barrel protein n=1 Tax=Rubrobacter marinus TaxID=2653852 RepID=A0A6G8PWA9_9ACTN|nr:sugar phosphate isomerase/epimerase family protein [Rubrobacter marinus]QIN78490.1 TIM barrel protein [Rubrobacter marinus]
MARPVTLFTGQWADMPLTELAPLAKELGYDGLELASWGDHFDVRKVLEDDRYAQGRLDLLAEHGLRCYAISNHLVGQAVCDPIDERHKATLPPHVWGDGEPEGVRQRAAEEMKDTARAAARLGVDTVTGFTGSSIWHKLYFFPPTSQEEIDEGYRDFADRWNPILDVFDEEGVRFAFEVHPTEISYDIFSTEKALEAIGRREAFGFNFDPSHLYWQFVDPVKFLNRFPDRIYHAHMKDAARTLDGESGILASHLPFGDHRRGWDFRSVGRGGIDFEAIIRALNRIGYDGPLSVEWEDAGMDRVHGARESAAYVRGVDFEPSSAAFDAAFEREQ